MRILVTGATGQDGTILSTRCVDAGDEVFGLVRPGSNTSVLARYAPGIHLISCDLEDTRLLEQCVTDVAPDVVFCLGGVSTIAESVESPALTARVNTRSVDAILAAMRGLTNYESRRFVLASSGMIFEGSDETPQCESTGAVPLGPYAQSKWAAMRCVMEARERHGQHASSAILFNHESPLRRPSFVTRRVTKAAVRISRGLQSHLDLGDLHAMRDWGWAPDYVHAMLAMAQRDSPSDYVVGTGVLSPMSELLRVAFESAGLGEWENYVTSDPALVRKHESTPLCADASKAQRELGWCPTKDFPKIIAEMVEFDAKLLDEPDSLWKIPVEA